MSYELHGATLAQLEIEAQRLCPKGYEVLHRWQRYSRPEKEGGSVAGWWTRVGESVGTSGDNDAQSMVSCKA